MKYEPVWPEQYYLFGKAALILSCLLLYLSPVQAGEQADKPLAGAKPGGSARTGPPRRGKLHNGKVRRPPFGTLTHIPSRAGGRPGIALRILPPRKPRYENGAPVVIHVPGGTGPGSLHGRPEYTRFGFVEIFFAFPGGGSGKERSGGRYDFRGPGSLRALADVIRFAVGRTADKKGRKIDSLASGATVLKGNCGLLGLSHGGNACGCVMACHGREFPHLAFYVSMESPYGEGAVNVELGGFQSGVNPAYSPKTGKLDLSSLAFSRKIPPIPFRRRMQRNPGVRGAFYFDINGDGKFQIDKDFPAHVIMTAGKAYYSPRLLREAERRSLFDSNRPAHIPSLAEAEEYWRYRDGANCIHRAVENCQKVSVIVYGSIRDHVQAAPDHPHILTQVEGFRRAGARFVRLNPDSAYVEYILGAGKRSRPVPEEIVDNPAGAAYTRANMREALEPEGVPARVYMYASVCELADRTQSKNWSKDLKGVIFPKAPAAPPFRTRIRKRRPAGRGGLEPGRPGKQPFSGKAPNGSYGAGTKECTVDCSATCGEIRSLLGVNRGPYTYPSPRRRNRKTKKPIDHVASYRRLGIDSIRTHDFYGPTDWYVIFPDWEADPDAPASYDFRSSDKRIRAICENGFECFYRLGTSWKGRSSRPINDPPGTVRDDRGSITHRAGRRDFRKWAKICVNTVRHYTEGWKDGFDFPIRYWEIWNEPDLAAQFWTGTERQYYMMYEEAARAIKAENPELKVGGPACTGALPKEYVEGFIKFCRDRDVPLDFFSWHSYGGRGPFNPYNYYVAARRIRKALDRNGFVETENINDEWNAGIRRRLFSNTPGGAAYYGSALVYFLDGGIDKAFQYCGVAHPGLGLHSRETGKPKICAYAFAAWKRLLETPERVKASGTDKRGFTILAAQDKEEKKLRILISDFQSGYTRVRIHVKNMPWAKKQRFRLREFLVDSQHRLDCAKERFGTGPDLLIKRPFRAGTICLVEIRALGR